jgi:hypothetical protein
MNLHTKVIKHLEKQKGYDFESEWWDDDMIATLYDIVYATEKILKKEQEKKNITTFESLPESKL